MVNSYICLNEKSINDLIAQGANLLLYGPPGIGKTHAVERLASAMELPLFSVCASQQQTQDDLLGMPILRASASGGADSRWIDGPLPLAMKSQAGAILYIDEIDRLAAGVFAILHPLLDHRRELHLSTPEGSVKIQAHPSFRVIATANSTKDIDQALLDRFVVLPFPPSPYETAVSDETAKVISAVVKHGIAPPTARKARHLELLLQSGVDVGEAISIVLLDATKASAIKMGALFFLGDQIPLFDASVAQESSDQEPGGLDGLVA